MWVPLPSAFASSYRFLVAMGNLLVSLLDFSVEGCPLTPHNILKGSVNARKRGSVIYTHTMSLDYL